MSLPPMVAFKMPGTAVTVVSGRRNHRAVTLREGSLMRCWFLCPGPLALPPGGWIR